MVYKISQEILDRSVVKYLTLGVYIICVHITERQHRGQGLGMLHFLAPWVTGILFLSATQHEIIYSGDYLLTCGRHKYCVNRQRLCVFISYADGSFIKQGLKETQSSVTLLDSVSLVETVLWNRKRAKLIFCLHFMKKLACNLSFCDSC